MSPIVNIVLVFSIIVLIILIIIGFFRKKQWKQSIIELLVLMVIIFLLNFSTGFPRATTSFGSFTPLWIIILLLFFVLMGMVANYFFHIKKKFDWFSLVKPFFISPIVLMPILGSINFNDLELIQIIALSFLAFQNGFFWKEIFNKVHISTVS